MNQIAKNASRFFVGVVVFCAIALAPMHAYAQAAWGTLIAQGVPPLGYGAVRAGGVLPDSGLYDRLPISESEHGIEAAGLGPDVGDLI